METVFGINGLQALGIGLGALVLFAFVFMAVRVNSITFRLSAGAVIVALAASARLNVRMLKMASDPELVLWPAVHVCAVCGHRIYAWDEDEPVPVHRAIYVPPEEWYRATRHARKERAAARPCDARDDDCAGDFTVDDVIDLHMALDTSGSMASDVDRPPRYRHVRCPAQPQRSDGSIKLEVHP